MRVEIYNKHPDSDEYFLARLEMPASHYEVYDALQRVRFNEGDELDLNISSCKEFPEIVNHHIDRANLFELNYFANRLKRLEDFEQANLRAVFIKRRPVHYQQGIMMEELINLTYGVNQIASVANMHTVEQLGEFVLNNNMDSRLEMYDSSILNLIDREKLGQAQVDVDGGVFVDGYYVAAGMFVLPEIYKSNPVKDYEYLNLDSVFAIEIAKAPVRDEPTDNNTRWLHLPMSKERANLVAKDLGANCVEECVFYGYDSAIPYISRDDFASMEYFDRLNLLAEKFMKLKPEDQVKLKAVIEGNYLFGIEGAITAIDYLDRYDFYPYAETEDQFYREYIAQNSDIRLDTRWLNNACTNDAVNLLNVVGARITEYGIVSLGMDRNLFKAVDYHKPISYPMSDNDFEVIEVCGQIGLFSNSRLYQNDIPEGCYKYDFRSDEYEDFSTIEKNVYVNHSGSVIVKNPIDLGEEGYISFDRDSSPNFLGGTAQVSEFLEDDFEEGVIEDYEQDDGNMTL